MTVSSPEPVKDVSILANKVLSSTRYLVDAEGGKTDVVLSLPMWDNLLALLEDLDDREIIRNWLPTLKEAPLSSGALRWDDISDEGDDGVTI